MIEWILSQSGLKIPTRNGRILCSSRDPIKEADRWVASLPPNLFPSVVVIGLGGGFHIESLINHSPTDQVSFTVIEFDHDLILEFFNRSPNIAKNITWITNGDEITDLFWENAGEIFLFRPAIQGREIEYLDLHSDLIRRDVSIVDYLNQDAVELTNEDAEIRAILKETIAIKGQA